MKTIRIVLAGIWMAVAAAGLQHGARAEETVDLNVVSQIREEGFHHSHVMDIAEQLTDRLGPRLTGSPQLKKAGEWTRDELADWGLVNAHLEPWGPFGRGWSVRKYSVRMMSPTRAELLAIPMAWSPATAGIVRGKVVHVELEKKEDLERYRGKLRGLIVLNGKMRDVAPQSKAASQRYDVTELNDLSQYALPGENSEFIKKWKERDDWNRELMEFFKDEKPLAVIDPSRAGDGGTIFVQSQSQAWSEHPIPVPRLVMAIEHYGRLVRLLEQRQNVELQLQVDAEFYDDARQQYNTVAEIPGSDKRDEIVMLGAHLDSWHGGTGATDNGAGSAVVMEAVRILEAIHAKPRRTIRIALWTGEEQGLLGSTAYTEEHFGSRPEPTDLETRRLPKFFWPPQGRPLTIKPEQRRVSAYFNIDNGTGKIRGIFCQENAAVRPIFERWMAPFSDLGMATVSERNTGGTDHLSFDAVGIPGFQFIQDPVEYESRTHHSNMDVYERLQGNDLKQASVIMASFVFNAASREEMLPRKAVSILEPVPVQPPIDSANLDTQVKPFDDFYQFANGGWLTNHPVPPDETSWGSFNELADRNRAVLAKILQEAAADTSPAHGSIRQKVGDFYASGMDTARLERDGISPARPELERIEKIEAREDLVREIGRLHTLGVDAAFDFSADQDAKKSTEVIAEAYQGGLGLPDRDYYLKSDARSRELRDQYGAHIRKVFELAGRPEAAAAGNRILELETALAKASMTRVQLRDPEATYHKMSTAALQELTPKFSWDDYFQAAGVASRGPVNVGQPEFFKELNRAFAEVPLADWKIYLQWHWLRAAAPYLNSAMEQENFRFYGTELTGAKELAPRWKRVLRQTDRSLGEALGQLYVERAFPASAKARALELVERLRTSLRGDLERLPWMGDATRAEAQQKLARFTVKIGYPSRWRDYSALEIDRGSYLENVVRAQTFEFRRTLAKIGKPVDREEWHMTPPTVNAYYNAKLNEIVFPAGILQPPFFNPEADDAVNYGGIGAVIGHEMTHGFDDKGRQFDADGNLRDWWTAEDNARFAKRARVVVEQFNNYTVLDGQHVNGELTEGENIADLGGLKIAYAALEEAWKKQPPPALIDGFTPEQRFFLGWAQIWRANVRPETVRMYLLTNPHSPPSLRCNGPLSNLPEFAKAFRCPEKSRMVRPPLQRAEIW